MTYQRSHVLLPLTLPNGDLLPYAQVTFLDPATGKNVSDPIYLTNDPNELPIHNPNTFVPAVLDIWMDIPKRFDIRVKGPNGYDNTFAGIDMLPAPGDIPVADDEDHFIDVSGSPAAGQVLHSDGTTAYWDYVETIAPHNHDGAMGGSTRLDLGAGVPDASPNETWVGYDSGAAGSNLSNSVGLGALANPTGTQVTALGVSASALVNASVPGDRSVALGWSTGAVADEVVIGSGGVNLAVQKAVQLPPDTDGVNRLYVTPSQTVLRYIQTSASFSQLGSNLAGATPSGVTSPFWLTGDVLVAGDFVQTGNARLAGSGMTLAFHGGVGASKFLFGQGFSSGALQSLFAALDAYGLLTLWATTATLAGSGSLSGATKLGAVSAPVLAGGGVLTVTGRVGALNLVPLAGTGSLTSSASALAIRVNLGSLAGTGTLGASGFLTPDTSIGSSVPLSGSGLLTMGGARPAVVNPSSTLIGISTLTASGLPHTADAGAFTGPSTLVAVGA